jgi:hypothetical protein
MNVQRFLLALLVATCLCTQLGGGCSSSGGGSGGDWETGGSSGGGNRIPSRAEIVAEGVGRLTFDAPDPGRVYIYDARDRTVVYEARLQRGDQVVLIPDSNRVNINGKKVFDNSSIEKKHTHRLYWMRDGSSDNGQLPKELRSAERVAYGRGDLQYRAPRDGKIFVWDASDRDIVYRSDINKKQTLQVSPRNNTIQIEGMMSKSSSYRLNPKHDYEIYFKK